MNSLIIGLLLIFAAIFMLRVARPQPGGSPARFLARDGVATIYALLVTAFLGLGVALTINGTARLVAAAYVH
jgi:hypothetical protein